MLSREELLKVKNKARVVTRVLLALDWGWYPSVDEVRSDDGMLSNGHVRYRQTDNFLLAQNKQKQELRLVLQPRVFKQ